MKRNKKTVDRMKNELNIRCQALYELLNKEAISAVEAKKPEDEELKEKYEEVSINSPLVRIAADDLSTIIKEIRKL